MCELKHSTKNTGSVAKPECCNHCEIDEAHFFKEYNKQFRLN